MKLQSHGDIKWRFYLHFSPSHLMKFLAFFNATRDFHTMPETYFFYASNWIECFFLFFSFINTFFFVHSELYPPLLLVHSNLQKTSIILPFKEFMSFPPNKTPTISFIFSIWIVAVNIQLHCACACACAVFHSSIVALLCHFGLLVVNTFYLFHLKL